MEIEWKLFADLAEHADDRTVRVDIEPGATVGDALEKLLADRPELAERVHDGDDLASDVSVLKNGTDLAGEAALETSLERGDEVALLPPVSGG